MPVLIFAFVGIAVAVFVAATFKRREYVPPAEGNGNGDTDPTEIGNVPIVPRLFGGIELTPTQTPRISVDEAVLRLATAMAQFETGMRAGFELNPVLWKGRAKTNNNPGNLRMGTGQVGTDNAGYAIFPTPEIGWQALLRDLRAKITGIGTRTGLGPHSSIAQLIAVYAPKADNNPTDAYVSFVSREIGIDKDAPFNTWVQL